MGASISEIVQMLARDFVMVIVIAMLTATPVAWYFMNKMAARFRL